MELNDFKIQLEQMSLEELLAAQDKLIQQLGQMSYNPDLCVKLSMVEEIIAKHEAK